MSALPRRPGTRREVPVGSRDGPGTFSIPWISTGPKAGPLSPIWDLPSYRCMFAPASPPRGCTIITESPKLRPPEVSGARLLECARQAVPRGPGIGAVNMLARPGRGATKTPPRGSARAGWRWFLGVVPTALNVIADGGNSLAEPAYSRLTNGQEPLLPLGVSSVMRGVRLGGRHDQTPDAKRACAKHCGCSLRHDHLRGRAVLGGPSSGRLRRSAWRDSFPLR
jgi:hypothetical protein